MCARFFSRFSRPKPNIVESPPPPSITHGAGMQMPEYKNKPYFIVASVEMGNTTTKCILTGVSLETGMGSDQQDGQYEPRYPPTETE